MKSGLKYWKSYLRKAGFMRFAQMIGNYCSFYLSCIMKRPVVWGMPMTITIEPTACCNLGCPECPSGNNDLSRKRGYIDTSFYYSLIDQVCHHVTSLTLYFQGEPFLHPDLLKMASYASKKKMVVHIATNAQLINGDIANEITASGIDHVVISVDGHNQDTYEKYRRGGDIKKVWEGIRSISEARKKMKRRAPFITAQVLVLKSNENELDEIRKKALKNGADRVVFKTAQFYRPDENSDLIPSSERWSRYRKDETGFFVQKRKLRNRCRRLWMNPVVTWEGVVLPCCFDKDAEMPLGNLREQSFREIWKGASFKEFRRRTLHSRKKVQICTNCTE